MPRSANPPSPPRCSPRLARARAGTALVGLFTLACAATGATGGGDERPELTFERHELITGSWDSQVLLTGSLLDAATENVIVVDVGPQDQRRVRIFGLVDGSWSVLREAELRQEVAWVDVAHLAGRDRLIAWGGARLSRLEPETGDEVTLLELELDREPLWERAVLHVDVSHDLNDDGFDDIVFPEVSAFRVLVQTAGGQLSDPVTIAVPSGVSRACTGVSRCDPFSSGRVQHVDLDLDGRADLAHWDGDHFAVHRQDERGLFLPTAESLATDVHFDSDDPATLAAPHGVRGRHSDEEPPGELTGTVLHSLTDADGDGVADLLVFSLEGGSLWRMHSSYAVHFGAPGDDGWVAFDSRAGAEVRSDGIPFGLSPHDFDRDGGLDVALTVIDPGVFKAVGMMLSAIFRGSVSADVELHRLHRGTGFRRSSAGRHLRIAVGGSEQQAARFPPMLVGDVDGDGRSDLVVGRGRGSLRLFRGAAGPDLVARRALKLEVSVPAAEEATWLADIDRDGRQDVVLHHAPSAGGEPGRVLLLLAR